MLSKLREEISVRLESRTTKETIEQVRFRRWYQNTINYRGNSPREYFYNFKYCFEVDHKKFFTSDPKIKTWQPVEDFKQYTYPNRDFNNCAVYDFFRVLQDPYTKELNINEIGGYDVLFVATNNSKDATMLALKFA